MEHKITVCANGAWGIQNIHFHIDLGNPDRADGRKSLEEIRKEIMHGALMCGYTSILHYKAIDGNEDAVVFLLLESEALADEYIKRIDDNARLKKSILKIEEDAKNGDAWASGEHGRAHVDFLNAEFKKNELFFMFSKRAFELIGLDVNDRETKRRILTNLGFYRTDMK